MYCSNFIFSGTSFDFIQFIENTLKSHSHPHTTITGNWSILEAIIEGNLNQVLINQMNFVDDIVHHTSGAQDTRRPQPYVIKATKRFINDIIIMNLLAEPYSLLNNVPVTNWIKDAVYLYENYTILGTTKLSSLNVFNDLSVLGKLNNNSFNENALLLQDRQQTLPGKLMVTSLLKDEKRFLTNNIEKLYADYINTEYIPGAMDNLISFGTNVEIPSHIIFKQPLNVETYLGPENFQTNKHWFKRDLHEKRPENIEYQKETGWENSSSQEDVADFLRNVTKSKNTTNNYYILGDIKPIYFTDSFYILDHFEISHVINIKASDMLSLSLKTASGNIVDIMVLLETINNNITFFIWLPESKKFVENQGMYNTD